MKKDVFFEPFRYHDRRVAIIHIGTMKVGTTSIQQFLRTNRRALYDEAGLWPLCGNIRTPKALNSALAADAAHGKSLIICDEGLWHFAFERVDLQALKEVLPGYQFRVIIYVRRPDEFLESWYLQGLKSGTGEPSFARFLASRFVQRGLDFRGRLPRIATIFNGELSVRAFERSQLVGGDAITDFLDFIGVRATKMPRPQVANVTPDPNAIMMAWLMRRSAKQDEHDIIRTAAEKMTSSERISILYPEEITQIDLRYREEIEFIQQKYGIRSGQLFLTTRSRKWRRLTNDQFAQFLTVCSRQPNELYSLGSADPSTGRSWRRRK